VLFKGTVRFNLDPENKSDDNEMRRLLEKAQIPKSLDYNIEEKGANLSSGEK